MKQLVWLAALAACKFDHHDTSHVDAADPGYVEYANVPVVVNRGLDVLLLVDDSPSMLDKQVNLRENIPNLVNVLSTIPGGFPDVHIGVATSDMGTATQSGNAPPIGGGGPGSCSGSGKNGALQHGTAMLTSGDFIVDNGAGTKNYSEATIAEAIGHLASVGDMGCGFEQHLEAMKRALATPGFVRREANLLVIVIADEDDCSMKDPAILGPESASIGPLQSFRCTRFGVTCEVGGQTPDEMNQAGAKSQCRANGDSTYLAHVDEYVSALSALKDDPRQIVVAGIYGPASPVEVELHVPPSGGPTIPGLAHSCQYQGAQGAQVADPAVRLDEFTRAFHGPSTSVCQANLSDNLALIGAKAVSAAGSPCLSEEPPDADPEHAGVQYDCLVEDITNAGKPNETRMALPACGAGPSPCWSFVTDAQNCLGASHLALKVERTSAPPPSTYTRVACRGLP